MIGTTPIVIGGGLAFAAYQLTHAGTRAPAAPAPQPAVKAPGANQASPVKSKAGGLASGLSAVGAATGAKGGKAGQSSNASTVRTLSPALASNSTGSDALLAARQRLKDLEKAAEAGYDKLSSEAKIKAATAINHALPAGLSGKESFAEASKKIGAAVGIVAAKLACSVIPIPGLGAVAAATVCATLGALIGGYLGEKFAAWAGKYWGDVKEWASKAWEETKKIANKVEDKIEDAAHDAYNAIKFW